MVKYKTNC